MTLKISSKALVSSMRKYEKEILDKLHDLVLKNTSIDTKWNCNEDQTFEVFLGVDDENRFTCYYCVSTCKFDIWGLVADQHIHNSFNQKEFEKFLKKTFGLKNFI